MYLTQNLRRSIQQQPHATATIYNGRRRSFVQLGDRVARFAGALRALGVQAGDRVAILGLNSDWYLGTTLPPTGRALPSTPSISDGVLQRSPIHWTTATPMSCWWMTAFCPDS